MENKVILPESELAAKKATLEGWISRNGFFYQDENLARYEGCTHKKCDCGEIYPKYSYCQKCHNKRRQDKFNALSAKEWDGKEPLCIFDTDTYFFDEDDLYDYCEDNDVRPEEIQLVICQPVEFQELNPYEFFSDELAEDQELPNPIIEAANNFNEAVRQVLPFSWEEGKFKAVIQAAKRVAEEGL